MEEEPAVAKAMAGEGDKFMRTVSLEELLEAGCHFGHQVSRQNSKAREYIFEARDNIHIIDLEKTKEGLEEAAQFIKDTAKKNGKLLVLGTKRQAQELLQEEKQRLHKEEVSGVYFVTKRWIGGTLTNYAEVAKNYKKLKDITARLHDPKERAKYTKKEMSDLDKTRVKLEGFYGGIAEMTAVPDAIFIIDSHQEHVAASEAKIAGIPTVGITDTNADPTVITHPIPANDDAVGSLKLITNYLFDAWIEGKKLAEKEAASEAAKAAAGKEEEKETKPKAEAKKTEEKKEAKKAEPKAAEMKTTEKKDATVKKETKKKK